MSRAGLVPVEGSFLIASRFYHAGMAGSRRILLALLLLSLLAASCGGGRETGPAPGGDGPFLEARNATEAPLLPTNAYALPELDPAGFQSLLGQLRGTPVLVNIWGSWCPPCRSEAPLLARAHAEHGSEVQFLGVDILDARPSARGFMEEFGWRFPSVFDPPGAIRDDLGFIGQPVTIFYDREGEAVLTWQGPLTERTLARGLRMILPG